MSKCRAPKIAAWPWVLLVGGCAMGVTGQGRKAFSPPPEAPTLESSSLTAGVLMTTTPTGLVLPVMLRAQPLAHRRFAVLAARALRAVYDEDADDESLLLALDDKLQRDDALIALRPLWGPLLMRGIARAEHLATLAQGLRALRQAYSFAFFDPTTRAIERLDKAACAKAVAFFDSSQAPGDDPTIVTIEPFGPKRLAAHLTPCRF